MPAWSLWHRTWKFIKKLWRNVVTGGETRKAQKALLNEMDRQYPLKKEPNEKTKKVRFENVRMIPASEPKKRKETRWLLISIDSLLTNNLRIQLFMSTVYFNMI